MKKLLSSLLLLVLCAGAARAEGVLISLGDSIARGYGLNHREEERYSALAASELGLSEINLGVNGQTASGTLDVARSHGDELRAADVILLSIGANHILPALQGWEEDAAPALTSFEADLADLLSYLTGAAPDARRVLITFYNPYPDSGAARQICDQLNGILSRQAEAHDWLVADAASALAQCPEDPLIPGDIHPGPAGHRIIAESILRQMEEEP